MSEGDFDAFPAGRRMAEARVAGDELLAHWAEVHGVVLNAAALADLRQEVIHLVAQIAVFGAPERLTEGL